MEINADIIGGRGLIDDGKLESALARPLQSVFGEDAYPTILEKAAVLLQGLAMAHAFLDGNKRTAWTCCVTFLALHGIFLRQMSDVESGQFVLAVVNHQVDLRQATIWLLEHEAD